jgi:uncharacterized protein YbjQ (UPF0145 family)
MLMVTAETVEGRRTEVTIGLVRGNTICARHVGRDIMASLRPIVGREITDCTQTLSDARDRAVRRMIAEAEVLGVNAIISIRFTTSQTMVGAAEILAYGTAVRLPG